MKEQKGQLRLANELRSEAAFGVREADEREMVDVVKRIEEAHHEGRWFITFDSLRPSSVSRLQRHGYGIQHCSLQDGRVTVIVSWK